MKIYFSILHQRFFLSLDMLASCSFRNRSSYSDRCGGSEIEPNKRADLGADDKSRRGVVDVLSLAFIVSATRAQSRPGG